MKVTAAPGLLNVGYGNHVAGHRVVAILSPTSAPMKRLREEARERGKLLDATQGRRTRSLVITDTDHVVLSAVLAETIAQRFLEAPPPPATSAEADQGA